MSRNATTVPAFDGVAQEARRFVSLAWPVTLGQLALGAMSTVDVIIVGQLGAEPLAALALAHAWSFSVLAPGLGAAMGLDPWFTRAWGAEDREGLGDAFVRGTALLTVLAAPMIALHLAASPLLAWTGQDPVILPTFSACSWALALRVPAFLGFLLLKQLLQARGLMKPATIVAILGNVVNLVADVWWVYGGLGVPPLGAVGAAFSTSLVQWCMLGALLYLGWSPLMDVVRGRWHIPSLERMRAVATVALPVSAQTSAEIWAFHAASVLAGAIGPAALAAHTAALNMASLAFMLPLGVGAAAATRIGNLVGARLPWRASGWTAIGVGVAAMCLTAATMLSAPDLLARLYTTDPVVLALVLGALPVAAAFQVFDGIQVTAAGVLRGLGDTQVPFMINLVAHWVIGVPLGAFLAFQAGLGLVGLWVGLCAGLGITAALLAWRIQRVNPGKL